VLHPSGLRKNLPELPLSHGLDRSVLIKQYGSGTGCALIECENVTQEAS
jgi:hypothetical protein